MLNKLIQYIPVSLIEWFENEILSDYEKAKHFLNTVDPELLEEISRRKALMIFQMAAQTTPAYRNFLRKHNLHSSMISTIDQFDAQLPETDKENYIKKYTFEQRCREGHLPKRGNVDESGGTSGTPTNWIHDVNETSLLFKAVDFEFNYVFRGDKKDYFVISAWSSGPWATGVKFCELMERVALVKNTTTDPQDIIRTMKLFGPNRNYLLGGYPPFIKNLFDDYEKELHWRSYNVDLITGGEAVPLEWVYYVRKKLKTGAKIASSYGASDIDIGIGFETPLAFAIREVVAKNPRLHQELFGHSQLPMIFQYNPAVHYINEKRTAEGKQEFEITLLDRHAAVPKIKYNLHDEGRKFSFYQLLDIIQAHEPQFFAEYLRHSPKRSEDVLHLPFLCIFGRSDGMLSFDGANVYPRQIEQAILTDKELTQKMNRFKMEKRYDAKHNPLFYIHVELKKNKSPSTQLSKKYFSTILHELLRANPDYKESYQHNRKLQPIIRLYRFEHPLFRKDDTAIKNRYIMKAPAAVRIH